MNEDRPQIYSIPDNFVDESRVLNGMLKTRGLIEGAIMSLIGIIPALFVPVESFQAKVMVLVIFAAVPFLIGYVGYNGDPISVTIKSAYSWLKSRKIILYDGKARALTVNPLQYMMERPQASEKVLDVIDKLNEYKKQKQGVRKYIEGETFEFASDPELSNLYAKDYVVDESAQTVYELVLDEPEEDLEIEEEKDDFTQYESDIVTDEKIAARKTNVIEDTPEDLEFFEIDEISDISPRPEVRVEVTDSANAKVEGGLF